MALPYVRAVFGLACIAFSSYSTVIQVSNGIIAFVRWLTGEQVQTVGPLPPYWWAGLFLAAVLCVVEVQTADKVQYENAYFTAVSLDSWLTALSLQVLFMAVAILGGPVASGGLSAITLALYAMASNWSRFWLLTSSIIAGIGTSVGLSVIQSLTADDVTKWPFIAGVVAWGQALLVGYLVARYGELLLFGRRKR
jgi:hypothetical protein